jgi:hypothetical protein
LPPGIAINWKWGCKRLENRNKTSLSNWTACPLRLSYFARGLHKKGSGKSIRWRGRRFWHKN